MNNFLTLSNIISIIAIIISIYTVKTNKKNNKKTLNKNFFEKIFFEDMVEKIPSLLNKIEKDKLNFSKNCEELDQVINKMLDKCAFYKFFAPDFYKKVKDILIKLDEELMLEPNREISVEVFKNKVSKIIELINELYKVLKEYYS